MIDDGVPAFLLVATGGSEGVILEWCHRQTNPDSGDPIRLIAHPGNNSLPSALEVLARLQQDGRPGRIFYLQGPDDNDGLEQISEAAHDLKIRHTLQETRIGLVGPPSDWLVASTPDPSIVKEIWGPTVVPVEMAEVVAAIGKFDESDLQPLASELSAGAAEVCEPTSDDLRNVVRVFLALKKTIVDHELDALTVRCFDLVLNRKTTGCFALAQMIDDGVIAGCEGDLVSTIGLLWTRLLLEETPWMANPAQLDPANNTLVLAHCTVPRSMVTSYTLRSHFESGLGVGIQGTLPPGPVTLLRIGGRGMDRVWLVEGEVLRSGAAENLCRTQAEIRLTAGGSVGDLLRTPLGNHIVLVSGHHMERLHRWCEGSALRITGSQQPR